MWNKKFLASTLSLMVIFVLIFSIMPVVTFVKAEEMPAGVVNTDSSEFTYDYQMMPKVDEVGSLTPSNSYTDFLNPDVPVFTARNDENQEPEFVMGDLPGPDYLQPPKHYKTLEMLLAEAGLTEALQGPPPVPVSGSREILVILVELSDVAADPTHTVAHFEGRFFNTTAPSVRDYFDEVSYGAFTYIPGAVMGWYPSTYSWNQWNDDARQVVVEAIGDVDADFNFAPYDTDGSGTVTNDELTIFMICSGNAGPTHHWYTSGSVATGDGVSVEGEYCTTDEFDSIGNYCHELGHDLGLPDLYDVDGGSQGIGNYGLMGGGSWTFSHPTAWSKIQLGWITPTIVTENGYYNVHNVETNAEAYILMDPARPDEYFLIENRHPSLSYYETRPFGDPEAPNGPLPDEGIVIYHIDETQIQDWINSGINNVNNDEAHKGVDVECADWPTSHVINADDLDNSINRGDGDDLWDSGEYDFHDSSDPCNASWYDGTESGMAVRDFPPPAPIMRVFFSISHARVAANIGIIRTHDETALSSLAVYYRGLGYSVEDITGTITPEVLQKYDMVMVREAGSTWSAIEIEALNAFICSGGGFVAIGDQLSTSVQDILGAYGISYTGIDPIPASSSSYFDSLHPIMRDVSNIYVPNPIESLAITAPAYWIANEGTDTYIMIAGADVGGRVLCLSDDFANYVFVDDNAIMFKNIAEWMCARAYIGIIETHGENLREEDLAVYYQSLGYSVEMITATITPELLQKYDMVMVGEYGSAWLASEITAVQDFIDSGGGFVAIGDELHFNVEDILETYGISDTMEIPSVGSSSNFDPLHPIMRGVSNIYVPNPVNSLAITAPAYWIAYDTSGTYIMIAGAEVGGRVLCLSDDFTAYVYNDDNEIMFKNIAEWMCARAYLGIIETHGETLYNEYETLQVYYRSWGYSVEVITATLTPELLQKYDMLIVREGGATQTDWTISELKAVHDFIGSGGGFLGIGDQLSSIRTLLGIYGISYGGTGGSGGYSSNFDPLHPIMRDVSSIFVPFPTSSLGTTAPAYWIANDDVNTNTIIAGSEDGGRVICLCDDFASHLTFYEADNEVMFKNIADWMCTRQLILFNGDSYDFSTRTRGLYAGGDFYYYVEAGIGYFWANNDGQRGLQDLGDIGSIELSEVPIPSTGYYRYGVPAVVGHTYVSLAQEGEEDSYIVFRGTSLMEDHSFVKIEYLYKYRSVPPIITTATLNISPTLVVVGNQVRFTADVNPDPPSPHRYTYCEFSVNKPDGSIEIVGSLTSLQNGTVIIDYLPTMLGIYLVSFYVPEQTIPYGGDIYTAAFAGPEIFTVTDEEAPEFSVDGLASWYWTDDTEIYSVDCGDVDSDGSVEVVTGGFYNDGARDCAQLVVWDGSTMAVDRLTCWYWTGDTRIYSVAVGNLDVDPALEIVTGGSYYDGVREVAQLVIWDGATLAVEDLTTWYWTDNTTILSVAIEDIDGDGAAEIITAGYYHDGTRDVAQLVVWDGETLAVEGIRTWFWFDDTWIRSIDVENVDSDDQLEIITGGWYYDGSNYFAQLVVWDGLSLAVDDLTSWCWNSGSLVYSVVAADVDDDGDVEIVSGGLYMDPSANAQLVVWSSNLATVENIQCWQWGIFSDILSLGVGDVDGDGSTEIVTGGCYFDSFTTSSSQLVVWDGTTLAVDYLTDWRWGDASRIYCIDVGNIDADLSTEIMTGGYWDDTARNCAQLTTWEIS